MLAGHGLNDHLAYNIWYYAYWADFAVESVLWLMVIYTMYKLAMEPLKGLQSLGTLVFRWAAAISAIVSVAMAFGPRSSKMDIFVSAITQLQQTSSILTLCLLVFVTFAIRPMGLTYRSRIFGISLGMGLLSTGNLVGAAWLAGRNTMYDTLSVFTTATAMVVTMVWAAYFVMPEPERRIIVLPTTSPFLRWNQISQALGNNPGFVAVGSVTPSSFAGAELEVMRRASLKMHVAEMDIQRGVATPIAV